METESCTARKLICQDFQILMRAEADFPVPKGYADIRSFYETLTDTLLRWATEREGEKLRGEYLAADPRERARFGTRVFRITGTVLQTGAEWFAVECRAQWINRTEADSLRRLQVWNLSEQTLLPSKEIIFRFPDGQFEEFLTNRHKKGKVGKKHLKKNK